MLIDYKETDLSVLTLVSRHIGQVHVLSTILGEVVDIDAARCEEHGLKVVEPTLEQVEIAARQRGRLSFEDHTCLVVSRDSDWTCVTNDRALRKECSEDGVELLWGLELMIELVRIGEMGAEDAGKMAHEIRNQNPNHITAEIIERFREKLGLSRSS